MATGSMNCTAIRRFVFASVAGLLLATGAATGDATASHATHEDAPAPPSDVKIEQMKELMAALNAAIGEWRGPRLIMPIMNPARGRKLFASKGCVTCHSINGVGGEDAVNLDAHTMQFFMNPFDFAARMWRGAATMIALQEDALGYQIEFTGDELADIIAFVHDEEEQHKFSEADIPPEIMPMMQHKHEEPGGGQAAHAEELGHEHGPGEEDKHND